MHATLNWTKFMQTWEDFNCSAADGLRLAGRKYGWHQSDHEPIVCLSGIDRNSADFHELALKLSKSNNRRVLTLDYRGRGKSERDKNFENYNIIQEADDLLQAVTAAGLGHINIIATSRGGLVSMLLSAMRPGIINAIILNDVGPQIDGSGLMRIKRHMEQTGDHSNWASAVQFIKQINQNQFPEMDDDYWEMFTKRIFIEKDNQIVRNYDPALLKTLNAIDIDRRLPDMWDQFVGLKHIPMMLIRGGKSDFLSANTADKMKEVHIDLEYIEVAGHGHSPDLSLGELPDQISGFFERNEH